MNHKKLNKSNSHRLKALRLEHNYTQQKVAEMLSVAQSTYSNYESSDLNISTDLWFKFASIYNVSVDYMMGLTNDPRRYWTSDGLSIAEND